MPSPFPGMDPCLEDPNSWAGVHLNLIAAFQEMLNRQLRPRYIADVEQRIYLTHEDDPAEELCRVPDLRLRKRNGGKSKPSGNGGTAVATAEPLVVTTLSDLEIKERRVEIRALDTGELVTVIEVLSPSNKVAAAEGRASFLAKRREITASPAHWVEIDLLRTGLSLDLRKRLDSHEYFVHASPVELRPKGRVWPIQLREPLPTVRVPLRSPDPPASLDLQQALDATYERGAYDLKVDYATDPVPALPSELAKWANKLLKQKKLR